MKRTYIIQWGQPRRAGGAAAAACVYSFKETESWREKRATRVREITTWIKERVWQAANVMEQWLQSNLLSLSLSYISTANKKDKARWQTDATDQYRAVQLRTWDTVCCLPAWLTDCRMVAQTTFGVVCCQRRENYMTRCTRLSFDAPKRAGTGPTSSKSRERTVSSFVFFFSSFSRLIRVWPGALFRLSSSTSAPPFFALPRTKRQRGKKK